MSVDLEKIREIAERVAVSEGLTLVDVELKGGRVNPLLRVYIDKPPRAAGSAEEGEAADEGSSGGVSHGDCEVVSEQLSAILDVEDPFPSRYTLEVSSPGLDRKLTRPSDFAHFAGRRARLVLRDPVDGQKVLEGRLAGFRDGRVRLNLGEPGLKEFALENITKAQLIVEI
jgi:ribosome maturation factor RimP